LAEGWLGSWAHRKKFNPDPDDIDAELTWFPIRVHLSASCGRNSQDLTEVFDEVGTNKLKIAFTKGDGTTQLYGEIVGWDNVGEVAEIWVSRTGLILDDTDPTDLYIYFDHAQADNTQFIGVPGSTPAKLVWDDNFKLVTHMINDPDVSHVRDSTPNLLHGAKMDANWPVQCDGVIWKAQDFSGVGWISHGTTLNPTRVTMETWLYHKGPEGDYESIISKHSQYVMLFAVGGNLPYFEVVTGAGTRQSYEFKSGLSVGWHFLVGTYDGFKVMLEVDGAYYNQQTFGTESDIVSGNEPLLQGGVYYPPDYYPQLNGNLEETRISNICRSPAWRKANYESQRDHFIAWSVTEDYPAPAPAVAGGGGTTKREEIADPRLVYMSLYFSLSALREARRNRIAQR